jgi:uncharacterized membrane protein YqjE
VEQETMGTLLQEFGDSSRSLVRQEIRLARAELEESLEQAKHGLTWLGFAAIPGVMALVVLPLIAVFALDYVMPPWLSAMLVAGFMLTLAGTLAIVGVTKLKHSEPVPHRTIETIKEDARWVKHRMS